MDQPYLSVPLERYLYAAEQKLSFDEIVHLSHDTLTIFWFYFGFLVSLFQQDKSVDQSIKKVTSWVLFCSLWNSQNILKGNFLSEHFGSFRTLTTTFSSRTYLCIHIVQSSRKNETLSAIYMMGLVQYNFIKDISLISSSNFSVLVVKFSL